MRPSQDLPDYVMQCAQLAAALEVSGYPKPGNVHRTADFDDLSYEDFLSGSIALGPPIRRLARRALYCSKRQSLSHLQIGRAIKEAVDSATTWQKGGNTHLGMILLFTPLAAAAGICRSVEAINPRNLRRAVGEAINATTVDDASLTFSAISAATPHTLGRLSSAAAPDLSKTPNNDEITLLDAMRYSARWDGIASEWSTNFERVFIAGFPVLVEALAETRNANNAVVHTFLFLLSFFPDTFVARKAGLKKTPYIQDAVRIGIEETAWVKTMAAKALKVGGPATPEGKAITLELDDRLRREGLNPGTTADITGASLMVALLCGWRF